MFEKQKEATAVVELNGVYRTVDVFTLRRRVYVAHRGGFARVRANRSTSVKGLSLVHLDVPETLRISRSAAGDLWFGPRYAGGMRLHPLHADVEAVLRMQN